MVVLGEVIEVVVTVIVVVIWQYIVTVWGGVGPQMSLRCLCRALRANDAAAVVCNALFTTLGAAAILRGWIFLDELCFSFSLDRLDKVAFRLLHLGQLYTCYW